MTEKEKNFPLKNILRRRRPNREMDFSDTTIPMMGSLLMDCGFAYYGEGENSICYYISGPTREFYEAIEQLRVEYPGYTDEELVAHLTNESKELTEPEDIIIRLTRTPGVRQQHDFRVAINEASSQTGRFVYELWASLHGLTRK